MAHHVTVQGTVTSSHPPKTKCRESNGNKEGTPKTDTERLSQAREDLIHTQDQFDQLKQSTQREESSSREEDNKSWSAGREGMTTTRFSRAQGSY